MKAINYRASAIRDLNGIADFTVERWGEEQARDYSDRLRADISRLRDFALRYPEHASRAGHFRKMRSGSHVVFYRVLDGGVEIVRILHARSDPKTFPE